MSEGRSASTQKRMGTVRGRRRQKVPRLPRFRKGCPSRGPTPRRCRTGTTGQEFRRPAGEPVKAVPPVTAEPPRPVGSSRIASRDAGPSDAAGRDAAPSGVASSRQPPPAPAPAGGFGIGDNRRPARPNHLGRSVGSSISDSGSTSRWCRSGRAVRAPGRRFAQGPIRRPSRIGLSNRTEAAMLRGADLREGPAGFRPILGGKPRDRSRAVVKTIEAVHRGRNNFYAPRPADLRRRVDR